MATNVGITLQYMGVKLMAVNHEVKIYNNIIPQFQIVQ